MESSGQKNRLGKLRLSYVFALITVAAGAGGYGYHLYKLARDSQINKPQPQVERLVKDLRMFQSRTNHFPRNFIEVNHLIWRAEPAPDYGGDGRQARAKNYYYYYTKVTDETCAFWALPVGPQRHYASSFFVVLAPAWMRAWKGRAMSDEEIARIPAIPSPIALAELEMQEIASRVFGANK
ncbi:MAG: hypothetical protein L0220_23540 [Acidobacteria bacterium]|nr:hypothetical protein [Acidobacteriota bacterium]